MADFKTHLSVASGASGIIALSLLQTGIASPEEVLLYFGMGTLGGILPDVDLDQSIPTRLLFGCMAITLSFLTMFSHAHRHSIIESVILWTIVYVIIRYVAYHLFTKFTVHRGIFHSIPAGFFFWFTTATLSYNLFHFSDIMAWMTGFFVFFGYLVHLILDEIYSVNLVSMEIKKSFGSALKIGSLQSAKATFCLYLLVIAMFYSAPSSDTFFTTVLNAEFYQSVKQKLLPRDKWFRDLWNRPYGRRAETSRKSISSPHASFL